MYEYFVELLKNRFVHGGCNYGSHHVVAGNGKVQCPMRYRWLVAQNVKTAKLGTAVVMKIINCSNICAVLTLKVHKGLSNLHVQ